MQAFSRPKPMKGQPRRLIEGAVAGCCALLLVPLSAQTSFSPSAARVGDWNVIAVTVWNRSDTAAATVAFRDVYFEAQSIAGWQLASHSEKKRAVDDANRWSNARRVAFAAEIIGWLTTTCQTARCIEIRERIEAAIPVASLALRILQLVYPHRDVEIEDVSNWLHLDPGGSKQFFWLARRIR